jgi:hypothetical protein
MLDVQTPWLADETKPAARPSITIVLDEPFEADDLFELVSSDKSYRKTLSAKQARPLVPGKKLLRFDGLDAAKQYMLVQHRSKTFQRPVFLARQPGHMTQAGFGLHTKEYAYVTLPSQVPALLAGKYGGKVKVDGDLVAGSPVLLDLKVEDPVL